MLADDQLLAEVNKRVWFHSIELREGIVTPGKKSVASLQKEFDAAFNTVDLKGKTMLDVGAWNGAYTVEAHRRGAKKITALDFVTWTDPRFNGKETFEFVTDLAGIEADTIIQDLDAPQLSLEHIGRFDVVLFPGVFYHLKDPIAATREVAARAKEVFILETYIEMQLPEEPPQMMFYPGTELGRDPTNWWGPNVACVREMLKMFGFKRIEITKGAAYNRYFFHAYPER